MARAIWTGTISQTPSPLSGEGRVGMRARPLARSDPRVVTGGVEDLMAALEASLKQVKSSSRKRQTG